MEQKRPLVFDNHRYTLRRMSDPKKPFAPIRRHTDGAPLAHKKKRRRRSSSEEHREQKRFVSWARAIGLEVQHQNNGAGSKARRIHLHAMGCTAGAGDLLIFNRPPNALEASGVVLEMKTTSGVQSADQIAWQGRMERLGWIYRVARSCDEAKSICRELGWGVVLTGS